MKKLLSFLCLAAVPMLCAAEEAAGNATATAESVPGVFGTLFPYLLIACLVIVSIVACFISWPEEMEKIGVIGIPACLAVAAILEILALYSVGNSAIWWCNPNRYGFWGGFFRFIPLMLVLVGQIASIYTYQVFLSKTDAMYGKEVHISLKPAAIALVIAVPAAFIVAAILQWGLKLPKVMQETGLLVTLFGILILGLGASAKKNIAQFGSKYGMLITIFAIIYLLGVIAVVWLLIVGIFQMIIQETVMLVLAYFFLFKTGILNGLVSGSSGWSANDIRFRDEEGGLHSTMSGTASANRQIHEKKEQQK